jgi:hypothetical protein
MTVNVSRAVVIPQRAFDAGFHLCHDGVSREASREGKCSPFLEDSASSWKSKEYYVNGINTLSLLLLSFL